MMSSTCRSPVYFASFLQGYPVLCERLGYRFCDPVLLERALTHRSFDPKSSYERLEFLGDALLGLLIGELLFETFTESDEGALTRMRATLVRETTLVRIADDLGLSTHVILGVGERKGGGRHRASILADCVEAIIAAVYLDSADINVVRRLVRKWYEPLVVDVGNEKALKDAKSRLQEWLQGHKLPLPIYELLDIQGSAPNQVFVVSCQVHAPSCQPITQMGESRRIAEQKCAELMINQLNKQANPQFHKA